MTKRNPLLAVAALCALAACHNSSSSADNAPDAANAVANAAPIALPPAIREEVTLRCKDNSLAHVIFFDGDTQVSVATPPEATPVLLKAATAGEPFTADGGWSLTGDAKSISLTQPGKPEQTCKA